MPARKAETVEHRGRAVARRTTTLCPRGRTALCGALKPFVPAPVYLVGGAFFLRVSRVNCSKFSASQTDVARTMSAAAVETQSAKLRQPLVYSSGSQRAVLFPSYALVHTLSLWNSQEMFATAPAKKRGSSHASMASYVWRLCLAKNRNSSNRRY